MATSGGGIIFKLEAKNVVLCKQISNEIERNQKLERKVSALKAKVKEAHGRSLKKHRAEHRGTFMSKIGSGTATEVMKKRQQREVSMLEHQKARATVMTDRVNEKCLELRRRIDDMRRDAVNQNERFATVQREVERVKLEMATLLDHANKVDAEVSAVQDNRAKVASAAEREKDEFLDTNAATLSFKLQTVGKKRETVENMDIGTPGLTPAQRIRKRMKELAQEAAFIREQDHEAAKNVEKFEAAFEALRRCTGLADLDDVVRVFVEEEDAKLRQMQVIQDLIDQAVQTTAETKEVQAEMEQYEKRWGSHDERRGAHIEDFKRTLEQVKQEAKDADRRRSKAQLELDKLGDALHRLFYALECEPIGVEMTMHQLTVDRERRGSFFGPVRRGSDVHKAILESMREEVAKGNVATLDFAKRVKAGPGADATEEELMAGGDPAAGFKSPEPTLYHKAMLPALSTDPDDETYRVRSMGTPTRRGTRGHARESLEQLMKTGVNPDNMQRYLAIVEQRCMEILGQVRRQAETSGSSTDAALPATGERLAVLAPPMEDFDAINEQDRAAQNYAADLNKTLKSLKEKPLKGVNPAWRQTTPALSPVVNSGIPRRGEPSKKKAADTLLPKVVSRSELEEEVMRDIGDTELSQFIRRVRLEGSSSKPLLKSASSSGVGAGAGAGAGAGRRTSARSRPGSASAASDM